MRSRAEDASHQRRRDTFAARKKSERTLDRCFVTTVDISKVNANARGSVDRMLAANTAAARSTLVASGVTIEGLTGRA